MNVFESLAMAYIADFLYKNLQHYDGLETVYATIDLKISELSNVGGTYDQIIERLEQSYVSASNINQPLLVVN